MMTIKQLLAKLKNYDNKANVKILIKDDNNMVIKEIKIVNINGATVYIYAQEEGGDEWTKRHLN